MLASVFGKTLFDMRRGLIWWSIGLVLTNLMIVLVFPSIEESSAALTEYMDNLPPAMLALFGDIQNFTTMEGYLGLELFSFFLPALTLGFGIAYGGSAIGSEEDSGTLDVLLSYPISRRSVLTQKFGALSVFALLVLVASTIGLLLGVAMVDSTVDAANLAAAVLNVGLLTLVFGTMTLALTGLGLNRGAASGIAAGLAAVTFLMNTLAPLADLPDAVRHVTPWYYYDASEVLLSGFVPVNAAVLLVAIVVLLVIGLVGFQRRDIAV
ncbi:MAG: ABC transporter permease subunit [Anaerolineales bacterium]